MKTIYNNSFIQQIHSCTSVVQHLIWDDKVQIIPLLLSGVAFWNGCAEKRNM